MTTATSGQKRKTQKVTFSIEAPEAKEVVLSGDFNDWDTKRHPMSKGKNGVWKKTVTLEPKTYEYKFLVDGEWKEDSRIGQTCLNCFGTANNILNL